MNPRAWQCRDRRLVFDRPRVLGIVNVTPDSFSDGGRFLDPAAAVAHGRQLVADGADVLDVGGESTRPGSKPVSVDDELARVLPVVRELAAGGVPISIDTSKAEVARQALAAGAVIVNDVTALLGDPDMPAVCHEAGAGVILMHMQGTPATMQANPTYTDVVREVTGFLGDRLLALADAGFDPETICVDPGIGFGKTAEHNLQLLAGLRQFGDLLRPVCLGVSRKGFLGTVSGRKIHDRLAGSLAAACYTLAEGSAHLFRVHDVAATRDVIDTFAAVRAFA